MYGIISAFTELLISAAFHDLILFASLKVSGCAQPLLQLKGLVLINALFNHSDAEGGLLSHGKQLRNQLGH